MAAGYIIAQVDIQDSQAYEKYRAQVPATIAEYGGEFLVRGGPFEQLEGAEAPGRMVVLRFESYAQALAWYNSDEYAGPKALRQAASVANLMVAEGVD